MSKTTIPKNLFHPRYWPTWIGLGFFYLLVKLPYGWQLVIGKQCGRLLYHILRRRRHIVATNLQLCFPELSEMERAKLLKHNFISMGIAILETGIAWWMPAHKLQKLFYVEGLEHVQAAQANGKGVLVIGAHFTTLELGSREMSMTYPMYATYREQNNPVVDFLLKKHRHFSLFKLIHRHDIREVIRQLKNKQLVWYAPDQDYGIKHGVFAPFFGVQAATITAPSRYVRMSGARTVVATQYRLPNAKGYRIAFSPCLENFPTDDEVVDATRLNQEIEKMIRVAPEQYLWAHRRFKTRPAGEAKIY